MPAWSMPTPSSAVLLPVLQARPDGWQSCARSAAPALWFLKPRTQYRRTESKAVPDVQGLADLGSRRLPNISTLTTLTKHVVVCREHKSGRSEQEREALNARFVEDIDQRVAALAKDAPNMKALEQFDVIKAGLCFAVSLGFN